MNNLNFSIWISGTKTYSTELTKPVLSIYVSFFFSSAFHTLSGWTKSSELAQHIHTILQLWISEIYLQPIVQYSQCYFHAAETSYTVGALDKERTQLCPISMCARVLYICAFFVRRTYCLLDAQYTRINVTFMDRAVKL